MGQNNKEATVLALLHIVFSSGRYAPFVFGMVVRKNDYQNILNEFRLLQWQDIN